MSRKNEVEHRTTIRVNKEFYLYFVYALKKHGFPSFADWCRYTMLKQGKKWGVEPPDER